MPSNARVDFPERECATVVETVASSQPDPQESRPTIDSASEDENSREKPVVRCATMTVEQAAVYLGLSRGAAYAAVRRGEIPADRIGTRWIVPTNKVKERFGLTADPW